MSHNLRLVAPAREFPLRQTRTTTTRKARGASRADVLLLYSQEVLSDATPETVELDIEHLMQLVEFCRANPDFRWSST